MLIRTTGNKDGLADEQDVEADYIRRDVITVLNRSPSG